MIRELAASLLRALVGLLHSRATLLAENALLRQQVIILRRATSHPRLKARDRLAISAVTKVFPSLLAAVAIVRPETVFRWRRSLRQLQCCRIARVDSLVEPWVSVAPNQGASAARCVSWLERNVVHAVDVGEEPFPVSSHDLGRVLPSSTPPGGASADRVRSRLLPSPLPSQLGARGFLFSGPRPDVHASLRPAPLLTPPSGALSVGFAARISHVGATHAMRLRSSAASGLSPYGSMGTSRHH